MALSKKSVLFCVVALLFLCLMPRQACAQSIPSGWTDADVGSVGTAGSASYANGVFTVKGAGAGTATADALNYLYQPLSGDGTIVARVVSAQGGSTIGAGVMIRETLTAGATEGFSYFSNVPYSYVGTVFGYRATTGGSSSTAIGTSTGAPYWVKLVRSGNTFTAFSSADGIGWTQIGTPQTITMAQNVYIGLGVTSGSTSSLTTATFDNVSVSTSTSPAPSISSVLPDGGYIGSQSTISGSGFGATQGNSIVTLHDAPVTINSWSDTSITFTVPTGAISGYLAVAVASSMNSSNAVAFVVGTQPLSGWMDGDIGTVGTAGSASYANGVFTVKGAGAGTAKADAANFLYQSLSGDGTIIARITNWQGGSSNIYAGLMIRETLAPGAAEAFASYSYQMYTFSGASFIYRTSTDGSSSSVNGKSTSAPYWLKLVRSGNTFSAYSSADGIVWTQTGTSQTITMAQNVYIGLAVTSGSTSTLTTATFDNVSISTPTSPAPSISSVLPDGGYIGSQATISGLGFGATQGSSIVTLNDAPVTINSWSDTSITFTVPTGAVSGYLAVAVAPTMNSSNAVAFVVGTQPQSGWMDGDVGAVGTAGSAAYANGLFTVNGAGAGTSTTDAFNFLYQPLSGDGTIVARFINWQGGSSSINAGLMIRETLAPGAIEAFAAYSYTAYSFTGAAFNYRASVDASTQSAGSSTQGRPLWLKLVRSGNVFTTYCSLDGITWTQVGTSQTITMAQNAYIGLAATSGSTSSLVTATFDNVSISTPTAAAPSVSSVLPDGGYVGSQATISGSGFGATQGNSIVTVNDAPMTINSWSDTSITFTIPAGAVSGYLAVAAAPTMNSSNGVAFVVGTQPESGWMDGDIGAVGLAGSASYANGAFIVKGAGNKVGGTADATNFLYQPLSGDGAIVARVANWQGGSNITTIGLMIRETLAAGATNAFAAYWYQEYSGSGATFIYRTSTDGNSSSVNGPPFSTPYWLRLVRSGNTFVAYSSPDDITWTEVGSETITMAQNVYIGLAVTSGSTSTLTTATFDSVSISTPTNPPPVITSLSISEGPVGTPVTISGHGFGATQGTNQVILSDMQVPVNSWSDTSINVTIPSGAVTGPMAVLVGPTLNASNSMYFTIASQITPVINSLSPNSNGVGGSVTLIGSGFGTSQGSSVVKFNGTAASTTSWSANNVTATVPQNATSGPVTLTLGSDSVTSNGVQFTVSTEHFTISGISPTAGQAGTLVTISGSGFGSNAGGVTFNGVSGSVVSWSDTAVIAAVPTGTSSGPVDVEGVAGPTFTVSTAMTLTDSLSNQTTYAPTIAGGRWYVGSSQGSGCSTCDIRGTISTSYDTLGNVLSSTDELNHTTSYTYDSNSNVAQVTQPTVQAGTPVTTYTYNSLGEVLTETDPLNHVTTNTYDAHGNLASVTTPAPDGNTAASVTQFGYNSLGELTQITDPLNHVTTMTYNAAGLIATITDPQNNVTNYGYDSRGNRTSITDALNHTTTFTYDAGNRLTQIIYPDSTTTEFGYDYRGRRTSVTDQNNKTTTYAYDDADRLVTVTDAANNVTTYGYDTESNLTSITDANNHTTDFTYDAFGRVIGTVFPSTASEAYTYDADNNLMSKTDRNGHTIQYVYDALNRLGEKDYPDTTKVEYTYDLVGKVLQVNDPSGTYGFSYDNMGRLTGTTANYSFLSGMTFTNAYTYDAASNRTGYTAPDGSTNTYSYDTLNRLTTLANSATGSFGFSYDALSRRTQMTRPNGINTNYSYDSLSRLLSVLHQSGTSTIDGAAYTLDNAGNRTAKTDEFSGITSNYTYDALYELTQVTHGGTTTESYSYDPVGNRTVSLGIPSYTTNSSNEMTANSNATYTYDSNGNTLTKTDSTGTTAYAWDYDNRLMSVTLPGSAGTITFKYDSSGRRIEKTSPTAISIYAYNGDNLVEEANAAGSEVAGYTQTQSIDEPLAMDRDGTVDYYEQDGLGSVTSLTASNGSVAETYTYDAFGNQTASSGSVTNFFRYAGREFDPETNLYFYRARYYDPTTGRFLSEDPTEFSGGINLYAYVGNRAPNLNDPDGTSFKSCAQALADLATAEWDATKRLAELLASPAPDAGHIKRLEQAQETLEWAIGQVKKYCKCDPKIVALIAAAEAVVEAVASALTQLCSETPICALAQNSPRQSTDSDVLAGLGETDVDSGTSAEPLRNRTAKAPWNPKGERGTRMLTDAVITGSIETNTAAEIAVAMDHDKKWTIEFQSA